MLTIVTMLVSLVLFTSSLNSVHVSGTLIRVVSGLKKAAITHILLSFFYSFHELSQDNLIPLYTVAAHLSSSMDHFNFYLSIMCHCMVLFRHKATMHLDSDKAQSLQVSHSQKQKTSKAASWDEDCGVLTEDLCSDQPRVHSSRCENKTPIHHRARPRHSNNS